MWVANEGIFLSPFHATMMMGYLVVPIEYVRFHGGHNNPNWVANESVGQNPL